MRMVSLFKSMMWLVSLSLLLVLGGCGKNHGSMRVVRPFQEIIHRDTLRAIMLYGSSTYFIYKEEPMGYDYDLVRNFADSLGVHLQVVIARSSKEAIDMLEQRKGDLIAVPIDLAYQHAENLATTDVGDQSIQVLVQPMGMNALNDVTQLAGKTVYVPANSRFSKRMHDLNDELGDVFTIKEVSDTIPVDALIEMVSKGKIPYTVTTQKIADLNQNNIAGVDFHLPVSFPQRSSWITLKIDTKLVKRLNEWYAEVTVAGIAKSLFNKYVNENKYFIDTSIRIPRGAISPYDKLFQYYAKQLGWRWQLLAAQAYCESRFDPQCVSWSGAEGLMQIMPNTAARFGVDGDAIFNPAQNIEAAVQYLKMLNMIFHSIQNKEERMKFILAAYHSGPGHVLDAMALASKFGKNPHLWGGNVETFLKLKADPQYYNDPVCQNGYFNATQTIRYVNNVLVAFNAYLHIR
ncbi:MAG: transglycosylase SLT domain-containing protein [Microbacter sp.]